MAKDPYTFIVTLDKQVNEVLDFTNVRQIFNYFCNSIVMEYRAELKAAFTWMMASLWIIKKAAT